MPIYLDDVQIDADLPAAFREALLQMAFEVEDEAVNPARALQLLRSKVRPLLPLDCHPLLASSGQPSWEQLNLLMVKLLAASERGDYKPLLAAATLVEIVVRFTTRPPREFEPAHTVEVSSFVSVCSHLRLPAASPRVHIQDRQVALYAFCKFCWLPSFARGVCQFHSTTALPIEPAGGQPVCALVRFKAAQRLKEAFDQSLLSLATSEVMAFHDSEFTMPFMLPASQLRRWLSQRRPRLASLVCTHPEQPEENTLADLLAGLYGSRGDEVGRSIGSAVHLLTPVTVRAEAWLAAWENRPSWGGARR